MGSDGILKPDELKAAEQKTGLTLDTASKIVLRARKSHSTERFTDEERHAIIFLGACWKSGIITKELFVRLYGEQPSN